MADTVIYRYTIGEVRTQSYNDGKFCLAISYYHHPTRRTKKKEIARSFNSKFSTDDVTAFDTKVEAMIHANTFRNHVEQMVEGKRRKITPQKIDRSAANYERFMRKKGYSDWKKMVKRKQIANGRRERREQREIDRQQIRNEWRAWRVASMKKLDEHIMAQPSSTVYMLLQDPPKNKNDISHHVLTHTMMKAMVVRHFLFEMNKQDVARHRCYQR